MRISDWSSDVCSSDLPIAADESAHVAGDVGALAEKYQVINIKLDKTGGLTGALALADAAAAAGLGVMTGSMISSSLSIAPALIIAARSAFVDLDRPLWLANDRPGGVGHGPGDRKSVGWGRRGSVRVELGGGR